MNDTSLCIRRALEANPLREPLLRTVIRFLQLPAGSRGLDAGCGIGLQSRLLAEAVGAGGCIFGLDLLPELLAFGQGQVGRDGFSGRISFCQGDVSRLPFQDNSFDWAWSADCVGYPAGELAALFAELRRVVRPGGKVILLGWSTQQVLPGYPLLEARLNAKCSAYIPFLEGKNPTQHFLRAPACLRQTGLEQVGAQTFVAQVQAPLTGGQRTALISLFDMLWVRPQDPRLAEDWNTYRRLCDPDSPDFILDIQDYYAYFTYTLFWGAVPQADQKTGGASVPRSRVARERN